MLRLRNIPIIDTPRYASENKLVNSEHKKDLEDDASDEDDEEEEEIPDDLKNLSPKQQMFRIKLRSAWQMALGTTLVLIFSDPMVDCFSTLGSKIHGRISPVDYAPACSNFFYCFASRSFLRIICVGATRQ